MSGYVKKVVWIVTALVALAVLAACGGGGGATVAASDPGRAYKGISSQAKIKEDNAFDLAYDGYAGGNLGSSLGRSMAKTTTDAPGAVAPNLPQLTLALKTSVLQLIMAPEATGLQKEASSAKVLSRAESIEVPGLCGGVASYSMDVNDATGSFSGTVRFVDFATDLYTFSGSADITGTVDQAQQVVELFTLSFNSLKVTSGHTLDLTGSISWTFDFAAPADTMAMNMVLLDESSGKMQWFKDYIVKSSYGYEFMTQDISGRYFHSDHGFVDLTTDATIVIDYRYEWPRQGTITFSGSGRTSVRLTFEQDRIFVGADLDGDNIVDLQDEIFLYPLELDDAASTEAGFSSTAEQSFSPSVDNTDNAPNTTNNDNDNDNDNGNGNNGDNSDSNGSNGRKEKPFGQMQVS